MKNFIINLLDLKQEELEKFDIYEESNKVFINIRLKRKSCHCPACFKTSSKVKEYKNKKIGHQVLNGRDTFIIYECRRYICPYCSKTFNEPNSLDKSYSCITNATLLAILNSLKHYTSTFTTVANQFGVSITTVVRIFDNHVQIKRHVLQEVICIDEFYFNRHSQYKYAFIIMGFKNKLILDIVESRRSNKLNDYFFSIPLSERLRVKYVCMDMYHYYRQVISLYLPNAIICIDSFHVLKKINDSLNSTRKRIMRRYAGDKTCIQYRLLKYRYKLLLRNGSSLSNNTFFTDGVLGYTTCETGVLECLLDISSELRTAYLIKEEYQKFNSITEKDFNYDDHKQYIEALIQTMLTSNVKETRDAGKTIKNWRIEILNSFVWFEGRRVSNGCIEGKNNYIKKIISNGNGLRNFTRARNRIMYSQNLYDTYTITIHQKP